MTTTTEAKPWDLSHVLDLVNSLSFLPEPSPPSLPRDKELRPEGDGIPKSIESTAVDNAHYNGSKEELQSLGDFSKLWQFLGTAEDSSVASLAVQPPPADNHLLTDRRDFAGYTSDSVLHSKPSRNVISTSKQQEQQAPLHYQSSAEDETADTASDGSMVSTTRELTKSQRKKKNRKARRQLEASLAKVRAEKAAQASVSDSEAKHALHTTPTKPKILRIVDPPGAKPYNLRGRDADGKAICATDLGGANDASAETVDIQNVGGTFYIRSAKDSGLTFSTSNPEQARVRQRSNPAPIQPKTSTISMDDILQNQPSVIPVKGSAQKLVPSTVQPPPRTPTRPISLQPSSLPNGGSVPQKHVKAKKSSIPRSGEERDWALLLKLIADFPEDRKHLISPMNLTTHNNDPKGIHVFVDASNIFIGFKDQLKYSQGIPHHVQTPNVDLSFDSLALLMERRRPVAKRVLVGSTPHLPAFDKAKAVGYECNILEKVYKARELTERQIYFKELDRARLNRKHAKAPLANNVATINGGSGSGSGSGSETIAPQYAPASYIEQGVDEILHMKILESIVDTETPSTIVLATGDAARAEYSEGFMVMLERALKRGWRVELVSWSKNISAMYTKREWTQAWGERFCIVTLDDYVEELHDLYRALDLSTPYQDTDRLASKIEFNHVTSQASMVSPLPNSLATYKDHALETERLLLRGAVPEDSEYLYQVFKDAEAMKYWSEPPHKDLTRTQEWVKSMIQAKECNGSTDFIICLKPDKKPIGKIGIWSGDEIGFILDRSQWHRGLAVEAMNKILPHLFNDRRFNSISADTDPRNKTSIGLLKKFGFEEERYEEKTFQIDGEWVDSLYLRLTKDKWSQHDGS